MMFYEQEDNHTEHPSNHLATP